MAITLVRSYASYPAGATVELTSELEAALIAQGLATTALVTAVTTGNQTANVYEGTAAIAAGAGSVVITNSNITAQSKVWAAVAQATADTTLVRVERIVAGDGLVTIYGTANATATTLIDWAIINPHGATVRN